MAKEKDKKKKKKIIKTILDFLALSDKLGLIIGGQVGLFLKVFDIFIEFIRDRYEKSLEKSKQIKDKIKDKVNGNKKSSTKDNET
ncbi:MAG: hypothetical protein GXO75_08235 [Calditrichaeota bacterium]|nr:hypothetical protein [Calditrichota bacterium]